MTPVAAPVVQRDDEMPRPASPSEEQLTEESLLTSPIRTSSRSFEPPISSS